MSTDERAKLLIEASREAVECWAEYAGLHSDKDIDEDSPDRRDIESRMYVAMQQLSAEVNR